MRIVFYIFACFVYQWLVCSVNTVITWFSTITCVSGCFRNNSGSAHTEVVSVQSMSRHDSGELLAKSGIPVCWHTENFTHVSINSAKLYAIIVEFEVTDWHTTNSTQQPQLQLTIINFLQHEKRFEGFCQALEANDQHGVVMRHGGVTVPLSIKYG